MNKMFYNLFVLRKIIKDGLCLVKLDQLRLFYVFSSLLYMVFEGFYFGVFIFDRLV